MFASIGIVDSQRSRMIRASVAAGEKELMLPMLPYADYVCHTEPPSGEWEKPFKRFYHIPEDVIVKFE